MKKRLPTERDIVGMVMRKLREVGWASADTVAKSLRREEVGGLKTFRVNDYSVSRLLIRLAENGFLEERLEGQYARYYKGSKNLLVWSDESGSRADPPSERPPHSGDSGSDGPQITHADIISAAKALAAGCEAFCAASVSRRYGVDPKSPAAKMVSPMLKHFATEGGFLRDCTDEVKAGTRGRWYCSVDNPAPETPHYIAYGRFGKIEEDATPVGPATDADTASVQPLPVADPDRDRLIDALVEVNRSVNSLSSIIASAKDEFASVWKTGDPAALIQLAVEEAVRQASAAKLSQSVERHPAPLARHVNGLSAQA